jgi:Fe2+ or Zn2+ uptake regulation protein
MASRRNSLQKRIIEEALMRMDHPTAVEVYEQVRQDCPQISLGTVYRNLGAMVDEGEALRLSFAGEPDRFDPKTHEHFHVVCNCCGRIYDADCGVVCESLRELDHAIERTTGVRVHERVFLFGGVCATCRDARAVTTARAATATAARTAAATATRATATTTRVRAATAAPALRQEAS